MKMIKLYTTVLPAIWVMIAVYLVFYNAYHHNFQLLFLTIVTLINSVGIGTLLNKLKK